MATKEKKVTVRRGKKDAQPEEVKKADEVKNWADDSKDVEKEEKLVHIS